MTSKRVLTGISMLFVFALLSACGDHDGGASGDGTERVTAVIGPAGGANSVSAFGINATTGALSGVGAPVGAGGYSYSVFVIGTIHT